jgi:hypothetical protein
MEATSPIACTTVGGLPATLSPENTPELDIRALPPHTAISYGYTLYKAYSKQKGSCARREAREIVHDMKKVFGRFKPDSKEGMYLLSLRQAAVSFGNGIRRRKAQMAKKLKAARTDMQRFRDRYKREQRLGYALSTGFKLLLVGGFAWAVVKTLLMTQLFGAHVTPAAGGTGTLDPQYVSLSFALGMALISAYLRGWTQDRTIGKALERYESKLDKAYDEYVEGVITEYRFAANEAQVAWTTMTNTPAPTTPAFDNLLIDLFCGHRSGFRGESKREAKAEDKAKLGLRARLRALVTGNVD